ncbi:MAG: 3'-5' exonuclease [Clostridia bacterium]|nr:3'-5' exonuclease [Clostridia bacterium]
MITLKRILLWIAAVIVGGLIFIFFTALFQENGQYSIPYVAVLGVALFFIIRALRKPRTGKSSNQGAQSVDALQTVSDRLPRKDGASVVSYQAMSLEESLQVGDYAVVDVETTGLHPETDEIIEVAAIRCIGGKFEAFKTLVFPRNRIPEYVTQLTGIRNIDVMNAPQIKKVAPKLLDFVRDLPIVAHNAPFDVKFIAAAFETIGANIDMRYIDTVPLARLAYPGLQNYKLATLIDALELIQGKQQHRAESDATATLRLFELCRNEIPSKAADKKRLQEESQLEEKVYHLNQFGMQAEAAGNVEKAIVYYEDVLAEKGALPHAYMRLAVIYKKQHQWEDVVRVCDAALAVLPGTPGKLCQPEEWEKRKAYAISQMNK